MPALASLEELQAVQQDLKTLKEKHPDAYAEFSALFKKHNKIGYKNIVKLLTEAATPEKLKGLDK